METRPYAGLTPHDAPTEETLPEDVWGYGDHQRWWAPGRDEDDPELPSRSFSEQIDRLPKAMEVPVDWRHPLTGERIPTTRFNAVVDPEVAERVRFGNPDDALQAFNDEDGTADLAEFLGVADRVDENADVDDVLAVAGPYGDDALHFIPTSKYKIINPADFLRPLAAAINDQDLADEVFGEFRVFGTGGKVSGDVFFRGMNVEYEGASEGLPIVLGLQIDWDHNGGTSVQAQGMGMDGNCTNYLRGFTDEMLVKHAGDVDARVDWREKWDMMLETLGLKSDQLAMMIREAQARTVDLRELPADFAEDYDSILHAFYAHLGLPKTTIAKHAAQNARAEAEDPFEPDWWTLHSGATYAITNFTQADVAAGSAIDQHNRLANDMLFNPGRAYEEVIDGYEAVRAEGEAGEVEGVAQVRALGQDLMDAREQFNEREETIMRLEQELEA